jgi:hypothetical protein
MHRGDLQVCRTGSPRAVWQEKEEKKEKKKEKIN